jgi:hypothetical protein
MKVRPSSEFVNDGITHMPTTTPGKKKKHQIVQRAWEIQS